MIPLLLTPFLAGLLGLVANQAEPGDYLARVRFLMIGATLLGLLGVAWFTWRRGAGAMRVLALVVVLVAARFFYAPVVFSAVLFTTWVEWLAGKAGAAPSSAILHYTLGVFLAALMLVAALLSAAAVANLSRRLAWAWVLLALGAAIAFDVVQEDAGIAPHAFRTAPTLAATEPPRYWEVAEDPDRRWRARLMATGAGLFHALSPHTPLRAELDRRFAARPEPTLKERMTDLEAALLRLRADRTSPRTPRGS